MARNRNIMDMLKRVPDRNAIKKPSPGGGGYRSPGGTDPQMQGTQGDMPGGQPIAPIQPPGQPTQPTNLGQYISNMNTGSNIPSENIGSWDQNLLFGNFWTQDQPSTLNDWYNYYTQWHHLNDQGFNMTLPEGSQTYNPDYSPEGSIGGIIGEQSNIGDYDNFYDWWQSYSPLAPMGSEVDPSPGGGGSQAVGGAGDLGMGSMMGYQPFTPSDTTEIDPGDFAGECYEQYQAAGGANSGMDYGQFEGLYC